VAPGGAELSAYRLALALSQTVEVEVVTPDFGTPLGDAPFTVHYVPLSGVKTDGRYAEDPRLVFDGDVRPFSRKRHYVEFARAVRSLAKSRGFDLIHTQQSGSDVASYLAGPALHVPRVTTLRGYRLLSGRWRDDAAAKHGIEVGGGRAVKSRAKWWLPRRAAGKAQHVFTVSEFVRRAHIDHGVATESRSSAVFNLLPDASSNAVDGELAGSLMNDVEGPAILFAGRLTRGKGLHALIEAMPLLLRRIPECRLVVAGGGDASRFKQIASGNLAGYSVIFAGHVPNETLMGLIARAAVVAVPSLHHEPLSRVLLEAIAAGKPVVSTPYGGTPELIEHGRNGLLCSSVDPDALATLLLQALTDRDLRLAAEEWDAELRRTVLDPERAVSRTLEVYEEVLAA
jgi:glycosyltransferase involved in cell wall biosynthesis